MTKKHILSLALVGVMTSSGLFAIPQVTMGIFDSGSSGNYRADPNAELAYLLNNYALGKSTDGTYFGTFCIEGNEYFSPGETYNVALNNRALNGGLYTPTLGYDVISQGTAYLYSQFAVGTLSGFTYNNAGAGLSLQHMIWWLEGEIGSGLAPSDISANPFAGLLNTQFGDLTTAKLDYSGTEVGVMNLTDANQGRHQDQLVYLGSSRVPESGWTIAFLGASLMGLGWHRRKLK